MKMFGQIKNGLVAAATATLIGLGMTPASAAGITFEWNPAAGGATAAPFTANNFTGADYSTITFPSGLTNIVENGALDITQFQLIPGGVVPTPGLAAVPGSPPIAGCCYNLF